MFLCNVGKGPAIVSYYGCADERGEWACHAHRHGGCSDIKAARKNGYFNRLFGRTSDEASEPDSDEEQPVREERERGKQSLLVQAVAALLNL